MAIGPKMLAPIFIYNDICYLSALHNEIHFMLKHTKRVEEQRRPVEVSINIFGGFNGK